MIIVAVVFTIRNLIVAIVLKKNGKNHGDNCQKVVQKKVGMIKNIDQNLSLRKRLGKIKIKDIIMILLIN